jgi:hypothetical protein
MERQKAEREKERQVQRAVELEDARLLMQDPRFRRWLSRWLVRTGCFEVKEILTAEVYARNARAAFGLRMSREIAEAAPDQFAALMLELLVPPQAKE